MIEYGRLDSAWSCSRRSWSFSFACVRVLPEAVMKRRLPVAGLMPCMTLMCHPPLESCQRVPVPFSRLLLVFFNF